MTANNVLDGQRLPGTRDEGSHRPLRFAVSDDGQHGGASESDASRPVGRAEGAGAGFIPDGRTDAELHHRSTTVRGVIRSFGTLSRTLAFEAPTAGAA